MKEKKMGGKREQTKNNVNSGPPFLSCNAQGQGLYSVQTKNFYGHHNLLLFSIFYSGNPLGWTKSYAEYLILQDGFFEWAFRWHSVSFCALVLKTCNMEKTMVFPY